MGGVFDQKDRRFDMDNLDPRKLYDNTTREEMVKKINKERVEYLDKFPKLDPGIRKAFLETHRL